MALIGGLIPSAGASTGVFANLDGITTPNFGDATPYPSSITVSGACDVISDVNVKFFGVSHLFPDDVDILLAGPGGQNAIVMSDVGGGNDLSSTDFSLDDEAAAPLPDAGQIVDGSTYQPTNITDLSSDTWGPPAPSPSGGSVLSVFDGTNPNGTWRLFVNDDEDPDPAFLDGWGLQISSTPASEICIPGAGDSTGTGAPYPDITTVSGLSGAVTDVNLILTDVSHTYPDDMDILLAGPGGQNAVVMADAGGSDDVADMTLTLDDEAPGPLPDGGPLTAGSYQPANHPDPDAWGPPAPTPTGGAALSVFDGTNPNGTWSLFVDDDEVPNLGRINDWTLQITHSGFNPTVNLSSGTVKEGKPITFHVGLSAAPIQPFSAPFATAAGSAKPGKDFKAASGNLDFASGETSKTVVIKTKNDPKDEKNEKFSLQLTTATGNVLATAKIKDNDR